MDVAAELAKANELVANENYAGALTILEPLANQCDPDAMALLGLMFQLGLGVDVNGPKSVRLLQAASDNGSGVAAHNLGTIYAMGLPGVPANRSLSRECYRRAKELGAQFAEDSFYD